MGMLASLRLLVASAGWLAAISGLAVGQERPLTGTVGVSSDYTFRGVSQTLSITGDPSLVVKGAAAVGVGIKARRPQITVHLRRLRHDGHALSPFLLQMTRTIK